MAKTLPTILKEAGARLEQYDFGSAIQLYQQALAAAPNNGAAAMGMAMALNRTGKPGEALGLLQKIWTAMTAAKPKPAAPQQAAVLAQLGLAHEQLGKIRDALESYKQAGRLVQSPDLQQRIKALEPLASSPVPVQQLILNARRLQASGQYQEAGKTYQAALQLQPDNSEVLHGLAMVLRALGASAEALPLMQKAVILTPDRADYFNDLGLLFQDRSDFNKAVSFHKRALKVDPRFLSAQINLGVAYKRLGNLAESEAAYRDALKLAPSSPEAHNNLGNLLRLKGDLAGARKHLQRALALRPGYPDAQLNLDQVVQASAQARKAAGTAAPRQRASAPPPTPAKKLAARKAAAKRAAPARAGRLRKTPAKSASGVRAAKR